MREDPRVQMWKPVREVFQAADQLFEEAARLRGVAESPEMRDLPGTPGLRDEREAVAPRGKPLPPPGAPAPYLRRRAALREAITSSLDRMLSDSVASWQKHAALVAVTSFIDERERVLLGALAETWHLPLIQTDLLGIDDGGDRFFVQLQDLLLRADVHELVFELHLLCLRAGFLGRYRDRRHELDLLTTRLVQRVRQDPARHGALALGPGALPGPAATSAPAPRRRVAFVGFPFRYYVGVAALAIGLFVTLRIVSNREVRHSSLADDCDNQPADPGTP